MGNKELSDQVKQVFDNLSEEDKDTIVARDIEAQAKGIGED